MPESASRIPKSVLGAAALGLTAAVATVMHQSRYRNPYAVKLESIAIGADRSVAASDPLRIAFVTDTHIGPVISAAYVDRAMKLVMDEEPDILLLGGDLVCESPRFIPEAAAIMADHAQRARLGALAVLGNHDYSNDAPRLATLLERGGVQVLRNEAARVAGHNGNFWVVGIDDAVLSHPDPEAAFAPVPAHATALALWHEPDWAEESAAHGAAAQLSGHSHGGQVRLPFIGHVAAPVGGRRYVAGLNWVNGMPIYTSRGVGIYRPPIRFRCSPEVTLVTLWPRDERANVPNAVSDGRERLLLPAKEMI